MNLSIDNISLLGRMLRKKIPDNGETKITLTLNNLGKLLDEARDEGRREGSTKSETKFGDAFGKKDFTGFDFLFK